MFQKLFFLALSFISVFLLLSEQLYAQEEFPSDSLVSISLKDGTTLKGTIVKQDETTITVLTLGGLEVKVPLSLVISIQPLKGRVVKGKYRADPNYSRLMFAPTGRPLRQGDGYFSDLYVFLPSIAYGLTSNISVMAGFSIVPFIGFDSQLKYIAPRIGFQPSEKFAVSVGVLYTTVEEWTAGITFAVASFGQPDKSFTAGVGIGYTKKEGETFEFTKYPIIMLAGNIRLSNSIALISENWFIFSNGENFDLGEQPFGIAIRFIGDRLAVDVGAIIIGDGLDEGFPIPWFSLVYNFGR